MMHSSEESVSERVLSRRAYSRAVSGSWIEHGPTTIRRRSSRCSMISIAWLRPERTVSVTCLSWSLSVRSGSRTSWMTHSGDLGLEDLGRKQGIVAEDWVRERLVRRN